MDKLSNRLYALAEKVFGLFRRRDDWTICGHCYGDQRGECIRAKRCINAKAMKAATIVLTERETIEASLQEKDM